MSYVQRRWERVARQKGRLADAEVVLGFWLCTARASAGGEAEPEWAPRVRRGSVGSFGTRSAALALTNMRMWIVAPKVTVPVDLAHVGVVRAVLPNVLRCEVLIPAPTSTFSLSMVRNTDAEAARAAIEAARSARWQALGYGGFDEIEGMHGEEVAREMKARWVRADPSRAGQPSAAALLGLALAGRGHVGEAEALLREAAAFEDSELAAGAALELGHVLRDVRETEEARLAYTQALSSADGQTAMVARYELGLISKEAGDLATADELLTEVADANDPVWSPIAATGLGVIRKAAGDLAGAEAAFRGAIATGHENLAPASMIDLAELLAKQGRADEAEQLYRQAIATGHPWHAVAGQLNLGNMMRKRGDLAAAEAAYRAVTTSDDQELATKAWFNLGHIAKDAGDRNAARDAFRTVADGPDARLARIARQRLTEL